MEKTPNDSETSSLFDVEMFRGFCTVLGIAATAAVRITELPTDYSNIQGYKGWSYMRTWDGVLEPFTDYGDYWNLPGSYCSLTESILHPNTGGVDMCAAPDAGLCIPSLQWNSSAYQTNYTNFTVTLTASHTVPIGTNRDGVALKIFLDDELVDTFETPFDVVVSYSNITHFRADLDPKMSCNNDGTSYTVTVDADRKPSPSQSATPTATATRSISPTPSSICYIIQRNLFGIQETVSGDGSTFYVLHGTSVTHTGNINCGTNPTCVETATACVCTYTDGSTYSCGVKRKTEIRYTLGASNSISYLGQSPSCSYFIARSFMMPSATATHTNSPTPTPTGMCHTIRTHAHGKSETVQGNNTYNLLHGSYITTPYLPNFDLLYGIYNDCTQRFDTCECTYTNGYSVGCGTERRAFIVYKNGPEFQTVVQNESACTVQFNTSFAFPSVTGTPTYSATKTASGTPSFTPSASWSPTASYTTTQTGSFTPTMTKTATRTVSPTATLTRTATATVSATGICNDVRNYVFGMREKVTSIYTIHHGTNVTHLYYPYNFVLAGGAPVCEDLGSYCRCVYDKGGSEFCPIRRSSIVNYIPHWSPGFQTVLISDSEPVCVYKFNTTFRIPYLSPTQTATASFTASVTGTSTRTPSASPFVLTATRILEEPPGFPSLPTNASVTMLTAIADTYVSGLNASDLSVEALTDTLGFLASRLTAAGGGNFSGVQLNGAGFAWAAIPSGSEPVPQTVGNVSAVLPPLGAGVVLSFLARTNGNGRNNTGGFAQFSVSALGSAGNELGVRGLATPLRFVLPAPSNESSNTTLECVYWNGTEWDTAGCAFRTGACECTHFTEFSARFVAVAQVNADIFGDAASVYSITGFMKHRTIYLSLIGIAIGILVVFGCLVRMDTRAEKMYQLSVENIEEVCKVLGYEKPPADVVQPALALSVSAPYTQNLIKRMCAAWFSRMLYQHPYISIFFKYDPRLARGFRFLFVAAVIFHTLFLSTFFYGYTAAAPVMTLSETIVLSLLTAGLNIPFVKFVIYILDLAGKAEYMARFPLYAHEYIRRRKFEEALATVRTTDIQRVLNRVRNGLRPSKAIQPSPVKRLSMETQEKENELLSDLSSAGAQTEEITEMAAANILLRCLRNNLCRQSKSGKKGGLEVAVDIAAFEISHWSGPRCGWLPTKSGTGLLIAASIFGWIGWCLNYFLLFASRMSVQVTTDVATSLGISQATSIFVTQPLTLGVTLCILWLIEKWRHRSNTATKHHIGYFADPRYKSTSTTLSGSWAYWVFFYAASSASVHIRHADVSIGYRSTRVATAWMMGDSALQTIVSDRDAAITALYVYLRGIEKPVIMRNAHMVEAIQDVLAVETEEVKTDDAAVVLGIVQKIAT